MTNVSSTLLQGRITELKCELWFLEHGYLVSIPEVPYQYDMLVDINGHVLKIQVKTCKLETDGSGIIFNTSSVTHNKAGYTRRIYNEKDVDYFMTYYDNHCYLIPFRNCGTREKKLRLIPTKNNQTVGIDFASNFLAEKILEEVIE